jgi:hypothetical protein
MKYFDLPELEEWVTQLNGLENAESRLVVTADLFSRECSPLVDVCSGGALILYCVVQRSLQEMISRPTTNLTEPMESLHSRPLIWLSPLSVLSQTVPVGK